MTVYIARNCALCSYRVRLRTDETFAKHKDKSGSVCLGSYKTVAETRMLREDQAYEELGVKPPRSVPPPLAPPIEDDPAFKFPPRPWWKIW